MQNNMAKRISKKCTEHDDNQYSEVLINIHLVCHMKNKIQVCMLYRIPKLSLVYRDDIVGCLKIM